MLQNFILKNSSLRIAQWKNIPFTIRIIFCWIIDGFFCWIVILALAGILKKKTLITKILEIKKGCKIIAYRNSDRNLTFERFLKRLAKN